MDAVNPQSNQRHQPDPNDLAAEVIRQKINSLYQQEEKNEPAAKQEEAEATHAKHRSKHQQYMYDLSNSGRSTADIQTAWHNYYQGLNDEEKHQVWKEFYAQQAYARQSAASREAEATKAALAAEAAAEPAEDHAEAEPPKHKSARHSAHKTAAQVKKQLLNQVKAQGNLKVKHHVQSVLFGLGMGAIVVIILLFGFFNERIIAPFITPSRTVSNTPIIADGTAPTNSNEVIIPKINVEIPVVYDQTSIDENAVENSLEDGVVHYATTPSPGEQGNVVIFGHSSNNILNKGKYKFAFVLLNRLQVGDTFTLTKNGKRYIYQVYDRKIVPPTDVSVLGSTDKPATATLITCDPPGTSINRLIVIGEQVSPSPSSNTASTAVKSDQTPNIIPSQSPSLWSRITGIFH